MRYLIAMRAASSAASKQSLGVAAAITGTGDSEFRPNITPSRSACSGFVGMPVDGPARCTSTITSGSSSVIPSPIVSCFSTMPGPLDVETPSDPPNAAPSAAPTAAISSSAWNVRDAEVLVARELLEHRRGRRDRIGAEEERQPGLHRRGDQPVGERLVAGDVAVEPGRASTPASPRTARRRPRSSRRTRSRSGTPSRSPPRSPGASRTSTRGTRSCPRSAGRRATTSARARTCSSRARPRAS